MKLKSKNCFHQSLIAMSLSAIFVAPAFAELEEIVVTAQKRTESVQVIIKVN